VRDWNKLKIVLNAIQSVARIAESPTACFLKALADRMFYAPDKLDYHHAKSGFTYFGSADILTRRLVLTRLGLAYTVYNMT
jgi:hypothetical protein